MMLAEDLRDDAPLSGPVLRIKGKETKGAPKGQGPSKVSATGSDGSTGVKGDGSKSSGSDGAKGSVKGSDGSKGVKGDGSKGSGSDGAKGSVKGSDGSKGSVKGDGSKGTTGSVRATAPKAKALLL
jgi:collagen type IV alpha